jgi:hypothetical protein
MCCQLLGLGGWIGFVNGECERWTGRCCERTDCLGSYWVWGDGLVLLMVSVRDGLNGVVNGRTFWGVIGFGEMDWFCKW